MERRQYSESNKLQYVWPKDAVLQVIRLWKENECLYNTEHQFYLNKRARDNSLIKITNALRKYYPEITPSEVKNKMNYLRGQYSRELFKIKEKNILAEGEGYEPSVFWYNDMVFLEKFMRTGKNSSNKCNEEQHTQQSDDDSCEVMEKITCEEPHLEDCNISIPGSYTPVSSRSMSQENPLLLPRNSATLNKVPISYSINEENVNERDEAFCNYIKMELTIIKNKDIKDELIEKIMHAVLDAKKEQKLYNNNIEKCFEDV